MKKQLATSVVFLVGLIASTMALASSHTKTPVIGEWENFVFHYGATVSALATNWDLLAGALCGKTEMLSAWFFSTPSHAVFTVVLTPVLATAALVGLVWFFRRIAKRSASHRRGRAIGELRLA